MTLILPNAWVSYDHSTKSTDDTTIIQAYNDTLEMQLKNGIIEEVFEERWAKTNAHYLPHHPVIAPEKSTKVRIIYNGSAKSSKTAPSLNDYLYKGENLMQEMVALLLRFRTHIL